MYLEWISWEAMRRFAWFVEYHCSFFSFLTGQDCGIWMAQVGILMISDKGLTSERVTCNSR